MTSICLFYSNYFFKEVESLAKVRILGFDPGTANMGWAVIETTTDASEVRATSLFGVMKTTMDDGDFRMRIDKLGELIKKLVYALEPDYIAIEDFTEQGVNSGKVYKEMATLIEHMRMAFRGMGLEAVIYTNSEWKKITTGSKGLNKEQVKHFVSHNVPFAKEFYRSNAATHVWDACGIAYARYLQLQGE